VKEIPGKKAGVWFVYDGACPICTQASRALRIRERFGSLHTLDARICGDDPLLLEIRRRGYDLDHSMVIYHKGRFYHGATALNFMARYGEARGAFNLFNKALFRSDTVATLAYPWMRGIRNALLRRRGIGRIDNLGRASRPIFQDVFGADWASLPPVFRKHYAIRPYGRDSATVEGKLDIHCGGLLRCFRPLLGLMGGIPPYSATDGPVTVRFESDPETDAFHFNRVFHFAGHRPYRFHSRMFPAGGNEMVEIMPYRFGWRAAFSREGNRVVMRHRGYVLRVFGHDIPLPLEPLLGEGNAEETEVDDGCFDMWMEITHPRRGRVYGYAGRFKVIAVDCPADAP
jgi:predicted DCC family thiol-disulfide oxidoreductase YuxK